MPRSDLLRKPGTLFKPRYQGLGAAAYVRLLMERRTPAILGGMKASELRQNIYRILDRVLETGEPVVIERKGRRLRIVAESAPKRLERLRPDPGYLVSDADDLVHVDWSAEWRPST